MTPFTTNRTPPHLEATFGVGRGWMSQTGSSATVCETPAYHFIWPDDTANEIDVYGNDEGLRGLLRPPLRLRRAGCPQPGLHRNCPLVQLGQPVHRRPRPDPPIIRDLIERSAASLSAVESQFAADSSGFSTCRFDRWYDAKWGKEKSQRHWLKAHIVIGTKTNIITAVQVTQSNVNDSPVLPGLLDRTAQRFTMAEVSADKAYLSEANCGTSKGTARIPTSHSSRTPRARVRRCGGDSTPTLP